MGSLRRAQAGTVSGTAGWSCGGYSSLLHPGAASRFSSHGTVNNGGNIFLPIGWSCAFLSSVLIYPTLSYAASSFSPAGNISRTESVIACTRPTLGSVPRTGKK